jgi:mRNA interferase MazF
MAVSAWVPERGDIIWIDCNPQSGREMKNMHPMLVLSPQAFNEKTSTVIGLPMSTAAFNDTNPFAIKFLGPKNVASYVLAHQPKSLETRSRCSVCRSLRTTESNRRHLQLARHQRPTPRIALSGFLGGTVSNK